MTQNSYTVTALRRWSCQNRQLPPVEKIRAIHVYDFDNTLFSTPLPNKQLWHTSTYGQLQTQEFLYNGGWWHNPSILAATGKGLEEEEARAWEGSWHEKIVELVRLSKSDDQAISVLLTGRGEDGFSKLIGRMIAAKGLEFDMLCLKPKSGPNGETFSNTMKFKQALLRDIVCTYRDAEELRIYEDRQKHVKMFRDFFNDLNRGLMSSASSPRAPFTAEVIQVDEKESFMDPVNEASEVQEMINVNNLAILDGSAPRTATPYHINRTVLYTGYLIAQPDIEKLCTLVKLPPNNPTHEVRYLASNIMITPRSAPPSLLRRVGGIGAKQTWKVTGIACLESRVWAARVAPYPAPSDPNQIYTERTTPCVVLATRRGGKPVEANRIENWQPVPDSQAFIFETTVGERALLRIDREERALPASQKQNPRKHARDDEPRDFQNVNDFPPLGSAAPAQQSRSTRPSKANTSFANSTSASQPPTQPQRAQQQQQQQQQQQGAKFFPTAPPTGPRNNNNNNDNPNRNGPRHARRRDRGNGRGGGGGGGGGGGRPGGGRPGYRSLDDSAGQGYGSGGMQY